MRGEDVQVRTDGFFQLFLDELVEYSGTWAHIAGECQDISGSSVQEHVREETLAGRA